MELLSPDDLGIAGEPDETGETFETNARIKARYYAARSGLPTLADDSGLEVDALGGGPGVCTRRYAGPDATDADNNAQAPPRARRAARPTARGARYVCVLALALPGEAGPRGGLADPGPARDVPRADRDRACGATAASATTRCSSLAGAARAAGRSGQWSAAEKNAISHRSRAARADGAGAARAGLLTGRRTPMPDETIRPLSG